MTLLTKDRIGALLMLTFCGAYWMLAYDIRMLPFQKAQAFNAQTMPEALGIAGCILSLLILVTPDDSGRLSLKGFNFKIGAIMLGLMVFYGLTLKPLGFILSTSLFLMGGYFALGEKKPVTLILASVPIVVAFWALMTLGLDIYVEALPEMFKRAG